MPSFKRLLQFTILAIISGLILVAVLYFSVKDELPSVHSLKTIQLQTPMQVFSQDGQLISQFGEKRRIPLTIEQFPKLMIDAILATEDNRFYSHFGVDPVGMMRAVFGQIIGENKGGGSTITMQVARNFFLTREQTYIRKLKEIFISFHIESVLTKDEILSLYLNKIELGHRAFGVGAAAQVYYGKDIAELNLAQIAVIAGLPKAPSNLNPISSPKRAKERRSVVLQRMLSSGYISQADYEEANNAPITAKRHGAEIAFNAPYIAEMAHQEVLSMYGAERAYTSGFKVYTTSPSHLQRAAQLAVIENLHDYDERHGYRGVIKSLWQNPSKQPLITRDDNTVIYTPAAEAWPREEILAILAETPSLESLFPAVVLAVYEQSIDVLTQEGKLKSIEWKNINWARKFIDDEHQGVAPEFAADIVAEGDMIWIRNLGDGQIRLSQIPQASGAIVAISPDNGAILAAVGGYSFAQSQFNRATQAKRQVGSNIKPFIYSAALDSGFTLASIVNDAPINQWDRSSGFVWRPKNSPEVYDGPIRVRIALAQSKNVVSVRLLRAVGLEKIRKHLASFGFDYNELPKNESLALGSASLTPLEVATGIAVFANGGYLVKPYLIERIEDADGNIVFQANPTIACDNCQQTELDSTAAHQPSPENTPVIAERIISEQNAFLITQAMTSAIWESGGDWKNGTGWNGTGWRARTLNRKDIAGKTGTTNEAKDAWFSGFSRHLVTTSWIGFDDHTRNLGKTSRNKNLPTSQIIGSEFGAKSAQPAWIRFMAVALEEQPFQLFKQPENIISVRIDKATGKLTRKTDNSSMFEYFDAGTEPKDFVSQDIVTEVLDGSEKEVSTDIF